MLSNFVFRGLCISLSRSLASAPVQVTHVQGEAVQVECKGQVAIISLHRPARCNAITPAAAQQLHQAFQQFDSDPSVCVGVLHGTGGNFCAGYDLKALAETDEQEQLLPTKIGGGASPMGPTHLELSKPVIAAISGYAVAGGLELAAMCDLRVVEEDAIMGVFSRRFGVPLIDGGTVRLPALIGLSRALDLILTGRPVRAQEALAMGLANRVVPKDHALREAISLAEQLCTFPQQCLRTDRSSAWKHALSGREADKGLAHEYESGITVLQKESIKGAKEFSRGKGRHGQFDSI